MLPIKIIKNFISKDEAELIIEYIERNYTSFTKDHRGLWFKKLFGLDTVYRAGLCEGIIEGLEDITELSIKIVDDVRGLVSKSFNDTDDLFLNTLWFVKHLPGNVVGEHSDTADGADGQFVYSAIVYLNTIEDGGVLDFPSIDLSIRPELGDLIIFPSKDILHRVSNIGEYRYTIPMWFTKSKELELKFK